MSYFHAFQVTITCMKDGETAQVLADVLAGIYKTGMPWFAQHWDVDHHDGWVFATLSMHSSTIFESDLRTYLQKIYDYMPDSIIEIDAKYVWENDAPVKIYIGDQALARHTEDMLLTIRVEISSMRERLKDSEHKEASVALNVIAGGLHIFEQTMKEVLNESTKS